MEREKEMDAEKSLECFAGVGDQKTALEWSNFQLDSMYSCHGISPQMFSRFSFVCRPCLICNAIFYIESTSTY